MILKFKSPINKNGWTRQLEADTENKTIKYGSFLFHGGVTLKSEKELKELKQEFIFAGYSEIDRY